MKQPMRRPERRASLFLDSGAYSSWTRGVTIDLQGYIDYVKRHVDFLDVYACLDVVGNPEATYQNQLEMERQGLRPLIVFHKGEDYKWLELYVSRYDYIGIGGVAAPRLTGTKSFEEVQSHLDRCFEIICDRPGHIPRCKVHGFGVGTPVLILRYPWYSIDTTSWLMTSRYGSVYVPVFRNGKFRYDLVPWKIIVSSRSPHLKEEGKHFDTLTKMEQEVVLRYFHLKGFKLGRSSFRKETPDYKLKPGERWFGQEEADSQRSIHGLRDGYVDRGWKKESIVEIVEEPGLCNDYRMRDELNIIYYLDLERSIPEWPWPFKPLRGSQGFGLL